MKALRYLSSGLLLLGVIACPALHLSRAQAALPSLCGDGLLACAGADKDNDGIPASSDCDDNDYRVYPGVTTASGCSGGQVHTCQGNGQYTACTAGPICEAQGGGTCKYVDCSAGSDSTGDGSYAKPWKTFRKVTYYSSSSSRPAGWYQLNPGDVVYLKGSGTCTDYYSPGGTAAYAALDIHTSGTAAAPITIKRYPGSTAVLSPSMSASTYGFVLHFESVQYVKVEDLDITGGYGASMMFEDTQHAEISRVNCHGAKGIGANNVACLSAASPVDFYVHHNSFSDVYDPASPLNENVSLIVFFKGGNQRVEYNRMSYTNPPNYGGGVAGYCFKYKHPSDVAGTTKVKGNIFKNCYNSAIFSCSSDLVIDHNLLVNDDGYQGGTFYRCSEMGGGEPHCRNETIEYNTVVNASGLNQSESVNASLGTTTFRHNVVIDNSASYTSENGMFRVEHYGTDAQYNSFRSANAIVAGGNCYFNPKTTVKFDLFGSDTGATGGNFSLGQWQSLGYDSGSILENPLLGGALNALSPNCLSGGWTAGASGSRPSTPTGLTVEIVP
ncbi:MAG: right-handed parallel beta-helix repeat-containing protein [Bdellovibrionota bacterium]